MTCTAAAVDVAAKTVDARSVATLALHLPALVEALNGKLAVILGDAKGLMEAFTTSDGEWAAAGGNHSLDCFGRAGLGYGMADAILKAAADGARVVLGAAGLAKWAARTATPRHFNDGYVRSTSPSPSGSELVEGGAPLRLEAHRRRNDGDISVLEGRLLDATRELRIVVGALVRA